MAAPFVRFARHHSYGYASSQEPRATPSLSARYNPKVCHFQPLFRFRFVAMATTLKLENHRLKIIAAARDSLRADRLGLALANGTHQNRFRSLKGDMK